MRKSQELFSEFVERKKLLQAGEYEKTPFDSENRYLYNDSNSQKTLNGTSPYNFLSMIPDEWLEEDENRGSFFYLLEFINWSVYFYRRVVSDYEKIKPYPDKALEGRYLEENELLRILMEKTKENCDISHDDIKQDARERASKKKYHLKPHHFEKIFNLFARSWYRRHFQVGHQGSGVGNVAFAYYAHCYLVNSLKEFNVRKCEHYDSQKSGHGKNLKVEYRDLPLPIDITKYQFHIHIFRDEDAVIISIDKIHSDNVFRFDTVFELNK